MVFASGVAIGQPFVSKISEDQWREVLETELIGLMRVVSATLPLFREQGFGNFVTIVSVANYTFPPGDALSSVPKAGMEALGRAIAKEEGKFGIRANMVAPGISPIPEVTTRVGMPSVCVSTVVTVRRLFIF
jgi:NAD(P)-dependent dehydrogenase (short-subunit alcohol dehydrogenase family)